MLKKLILSFILVFGLYSITPTVNIYATQQIQPISGDVEEETQEIEPISGETGDPAFCDPNEENGECPLVFDDNPVNDNNNQRRMIFIAGVVLLVGAAIISMLERKKHKSL